MVRVVPALQKWVGETTTKVHNQKTKKTWGPAGLQMSEIYAERSKNEEYVNKTKMAAGGKARTEGRTKKENRISAL